MKEKKSSGVRSGVYVGHFSGLIPRAQGGGFLHTTEHGPLVRYKVESTDGVEVPGSFPFDPDHYRMDNVFGAFGTPLRSVGKWLKSMNKNQFLKRIEQAWKDRTKDNEVNCWVPDTGYIGTIRPDSGSFVVKFKLFSTRNDEDEPVHIKDSGFRTKKKTGEKYPYDEDTATAVLRVVSGPNEGASFTNKLHYSVIYDEEAGEWMLDTSKARGREFDSFFKHHGINVRHFDPDDYPEPENLLPVWEPLLIQANAPLIIEVANGWINSMIADPSSQRAVTIDLGDAAGRTKKTASAVTSPFLATLRQVLNEEAPVPIFDLESGGYVVPGGKKRWAQFIKQHGLPKKPVEKYTLREICTTLKTLGYDQLAKMVRKRSARK